MTETELMIVIITFFFSLPNQQREGLDGDSKLLLCHAGAVLHQLSYQVNWELVVMWLDYKPVEVNVDDVYTRICI